MFFFFLQQQRQENRKLARRDKDEEGEKNVLRTLEMMMPAMLMRTLGPFSNL